GPEAVFRKTHTRLWAICKKFVDLSVLRFSQSKRCGWNHSFNLLGRAPTDNGCGNCGIVQRPCDGDHTRADLVARANRFEKVRHREIAREKRFLVVLCVTAEVILR